MITDLSSYITDGEINIDRQSWEQLKSTYSCDEGHGCEADLCFRVRFRCSCMSASKY